MSKISIVILAFNLTCICSLFYELSGFEFQQESNYELAAMKQAAEKLNVPPSKYANAYIKESTSTYSYGRAHIGSSTIDSIMSTWSIPQEFRDKAIKGVRKIMLAAKGEYSDEAFVFSSESGASLTTLLIVTKKLSEPIDRNSPVAVMYITINTHAYLKQLYHAFWEWHACSFLDCLGRFLTLRTCCEHKPSYVPRDHTLEESIIIKTTLMADQYKFFWERCIPSLQ